MIPQLLYKEKELFVEWVSWKTDPVRKDLILKKKDFLKNLNKASGNLKNWWKDYAIKANETLGKYQDIEEDLIDKQDTEDADERYLKFVQQRIQELENGLARWRK